jgi:hypothetical protein
MSPDILRLLFLSDMGRIENDVSSNCPIVVSVTDLLPSNDRRKYTYKDLWEGFMKYADTKFHKYWIGVQNVTDGDS